MRLIDAERLIRPEILGKYYHLPNGDTAIPIIDIKNAPTVDVVPLDKLCEWLEENAALPTEAYMISGIAWKRKLTKWMEGLNAAD